MPTRPFSSHYNIRSKSMIIKKKATLRVEMLGERSKAHEKKKKKDRKLSSRPKGSLNKCRTMDLKRNSTIVNVVIFLEIHLSQRKQMNFTVYRVTLFFFKYKTDFR